MRLLTARMPASNKWSSLSREKRRFTTFRTGVSRARVRQFARKSDRRAFPRAWTWIPREAGRLPRRGKRICPPAPHLSGALSVVSDVRRCRSRARRDGPTQSNADRRVRETARERTSCQPRSHESAGCRDPAGLTSDRPAACLVYLAPLLPPRDRVAVKIGRLTRRPPHSGRRETTGTTATSRRRTWAALINIPRAA